MSGGLGGGGGTSTTYSGLPPGFGWVAPGMSSLFNTLTSILSGGGSPYPYMLPDQQVAGLNPTQDWAMGMLSGMAGNEKAAGKSSLNYLKSLEGGKYLDPNNPALQGALNTENQNTVKNYMNAIAPSDESTFISAGQPGGSAYNNARNASQYSLANALSGNANSIIGKNYFDTLGLMTQAPGELGAAESAMTSPYLTMLNVGNQQQNQQQNVLNTNYQNQYNRATWPFQAMGMIQNLLQGATGFGGISKAITGGGGLS